MFARALVSYNAFIQVNVWKVVALRLGNYMLEKRDTMSLVTHVITKIVKSCWALWMPGHLTIDTFVHNLHSLWYAIQETVKLHLIKPRTVEFIQYSMLYFINTRWDIFLISFSCRYTRLQNKRKQWMHITSMVVWIYCNHKTTLESIYRTRIRYFITYMLVCNVGDKVMVTTQKINVCYL